MEPRFSCVYHVIFASPFGYTVTMQRNDQEGTDEYRKVDFLRDLKKASKKLVSEDDVSPENTVPQSPKKPDDKES